MHRVAVSYLVSFNPDSELENPPKFLTQQGLEVEPAGAHDEGSPPAQLARTACSFHPHCGLHAGAAKHNAVTASAHGPNHCHLVTIELSEMVIAKAGAVPTSWPSC